MTRLEEKRRAPELKSLGMNLATGGAILAIQAEKSKIRMAGGALLLLGVVAYWYGTRLE